MSENMLHCYILKSVSSEKLYIGYTTNLYRRIRQHNGEIAGGAKKTVKNRPWAYFCVVSGFVEPGAALRFEYRLQHFRRKRKNESCAAYVQEALAFLIQAGDGAAVKIPWSKLVVSWNKTCFEGCEIIHEQVTNAYF